MRKLQKSVTLILLAVLAFSLFMLAKHILVVRQGEAIYNEAAELVRLPDLSGVEPAIQKPAAEEAPAAYVDPYAEQLRDMDFSALQAVNSDVFGWILIPDTPVSYPLLQGEDNQYYLNHTWRKTENYLGAIFLEQYNSRALTDFNTLIYGHRMNNKAMFGTLKYYAKADYWRAHPNIYITTEAGGFTYQIFAAYKVSVGDDVYLLGFADEAAKQDYIDYCLERSVIDTGIVPDTGDRIVTLSTCTADGGDTRWVVQGVLRGEQPAEAAAPE